MKKKHSLIGALLWVIVFTLSLGFFTFAASAAPIEHVGITVSDQTFADAFPDPNFRQKVITMLNNALGGSRTPSTTVSANDITWLGTQKALIVYNLNIADLTGLEYFSELARLDCGHNNLSKLDLSSFPELTDLDCSFNQLTELNVANNTKLQYFSCMNNKLSALNMASNSSLMFIYCSSNKLTQLNVANCTVLMELDCTDNKLTGLDLRSNKALRFLYCYNNHLTKLDVTSCSGLMVIACNDNKLTALDVSDNFSLQYLDCMNNYLSSPGSVKGWNELGLEINDPVDIYTGMFFFYPQLVPGDVDGDGILTFTDLMKILEHVEGVKIITDNDLLELIDVDGDGVITFTDLMLLLMIIEGS